MLWWISGIGLLAVTATVAGLWVSMAKIWPHPDLPRWIVERPIAHRGLHEADAGIPENSLAALEAAVAAGYPIELDVRILADGNVVVFHDHTLARMAGDGRRIDTCTAEDLRPLRLTGSDQHIPLLGEALATIEGRVPILIELKNPFRGDRSLERAVAAALGDYEGEWAVVSFNPFSLRWFRKHLPEVPRGQLACDFDRLGEELEVRLPQWKRALLARLLLDGLSRPAFLAYHEGSLPAGAVERKRRRGLPVLAWTIRDGRQEARARRFADNIIFENCRP
ncbi:MAG: glycerophosphodiester phosphodiesterase family protein [Phycisphaerae bacterium]